MDDLIVATLQERRVDGAEGPESLARQPRGERHSVLLCNAHVKCAVVETRIEAVESCATSHRGVDSDNAGVALCLRNQCVREDVGVRWPLRQIPISVCCSSFHQRAPYAEIRLNVTAHVLTEVGGLVLCCSLGRLFTYVY